MLLNFGTTSALADHEASLNEAIKSALILTDSRQRLDEAQRAIREVAVFYLSTRAATAAAASACWPGSTWP